MSRPQDDDVPSFSNEVPSWQDIEISYESSVDEIHSSPPVVHISKMTQGYDSDAQSQPDNMLTDPEEYVVGQPDDEGDDVAEIDPDQLDEVKQPQADDCE